MKVRNLVLAIFLLSGVAMAQQTSIIPDCQDPLPFSCPAQHYACWDSADIINRCETGIGWTSHAVGEGGGGAVSTVFGRQGDVVAVAGDYSHAQIGSVGANDHHIPSSECAIQSCNLNASTVLGGQGVCLVDGTNCPPGATFTTLDLDYSDQTIDSTHDHGGGILRLPNSDSFQTVSQGDIGIDIDGNVGGINHGTIKYRDATTQYFGIGIDAYPSLDDEVQHYDATLKKMYWKVPAGGSGTPGGATTQVQYNLAGAFAGSAEFTFVAGQPLHVDNGYTMNPTAEPGMAFDILNTDPTVDWRIYGLRNAGVPGTDALPNTDVRIGSLKAGVEQFWVATDASTSGDAAFTLLADSIGPAEISKTATDTFDFNAVPSFVIPVNDSRALPSNGDVLVDATANQFLYRSGGAEHVVVPDENLCMRYDDLPSASNGQFFYTLHRDMTAISATCICDSVNGTCGATAPTITFNNQVIAAGPPARVALTGTATTCSDMTVNVVPQSTTGTILGGDMITFDVGTHTHTGESYEICLSVKYVRK